MKTVLSLIQAILFIVSSFAVPDSNFKLWVDRAAMDITSTSDFSFDSLEAGELAVSEEEKQLCRTWFEENILTSEKPAYTFSVGGKDFRKNISDWEFSYSEESEAGAVYRNGKTTYITVSHKKSDVVATVEATIYEDKASCDWTVYIANEGEENSPVISSFYAMNSVLPTGKKTDIYLGNACISAYSISYFLRLCEY